MRKEGEDGSGAQGGTFRRGITTARGTLRVDRTPEIVSKSAHGQRKSPFVRWG
jgi:hypothetical protein